MSRFRLALLALLLAPTLSSAIEVARKTPAPGAPAPKVSEERLQCESRTNEASDRTEVVCLTPEQRRSLARSRAARDPQPAGAGGR